MLNQIKTLTKLQLLNLYSVNVYRHTKDPKEKKRKFWLAVTYVFLMVVAAFYVGALSFGYVYIGLANLLPAYLILLTSLIILMFSIFKAGSVIFQRNAYDILASMPIGKSAIVVSRFIRLYIENLVVAFVVMLPAMVVFGVLTKPAISFYFIGIVVTFFIPFIPITIATFVGALITAISSRAKHKNLVSIILSMAMVVGLMLGSSKLAMMEEEINIEALQNLLNMALELIGGIYPPALWLGEAMLTGDFLLCLGCVTGGLAAFVLVIALVSVSYNWVSRGLYSTSAKHDYQMETLRKTSMLGALYKREFKRYFSSSIYVTNTIVSPVMGVLLAVGMLFVGTDQITALVDELYAQLGVVMDIRGAIPFALATVFCLMPTTCTSISLEGKQWWIVKSLPIKAKDLLNSKLLLNLSLLLPFYVIAEILMVIALRPSLLEMLWIIVVPAIMIIFSCVFGLTINLKMPVFDWENEVTIVKQSASAFVGGIVGCFAVLVCTVVVMAVPVQYGNVVKFGICVVVVCLTALLHAKNNKVDLQKL